MGNRKLINTIFGTWCITSFLLAIGYFGQQLLPSIFKKSKYMEFIFDEKDSVIVLVITMIITLLLGLILDSDSDKIQKYKYKISKQKPIIVTVTVFSIVFCFIFVVIEGANITTGVISSKNVETINGTVEKVYSVSEESNGKVATAISITDENGKQSKFIPSNKLESFSVNKKDEVDIDYVPSKYSLATKSVDGMVVGYKSVSK